MRPSGGQMGLFSFSRTVATCEVCGRALTDPVSVAAGIGPICAGGKRAQRLAAQDDGDREALGERPYDLVVSDPFLGVELAFGRQADPMRQGELHPSSTIWSNVPHHIFTGKSPDGYNFGYSGSGPAEFGINIAQALLLMLEWESDDVIQGGRQWGGGWCYGAAWPLGQAIKFEYLSGVDPLAVDHRIPTADLLAYAEAWLKEHGYWADFELRRSQREADELDL